MTQRDIPVQPGESAVTAALRVLAGVMGWCVTHTTDGVHSDQSLHYARNGARAVDLADRRGSVDTLGPVEGPSAMLRINREVLAAIPLPWISELICGVPGATCVKNGVVLDGKDGRPTARAVYGATVLAGHLNHNHLAVVPQFTYTGGSRPMPADDPNRANVVAPCVGIAAAHDADGNIKGYLLVGADYGVFAFGDGVRVLGNVEYVKPDGREWLPA